MSNAHTSVYTHKHWI